MLDERSASWKLLLPGHRRERLLVVGLDAGGVAGLARWWREVVWVPPSPEAARAFESSGCDAREYVAHVRTVTRLDGNGADYDTIALGAWPNGERPDSAHITSLLAPDGALVSLGFAGSRLTPAEIRRIGLNGIRSYAALPASQPRPTSRRRHASCVPGASPSTCPGAVELAGGCGRRATSARWAFVATSTTAPCSSPGATQTSTLATI